MLGVRMELEMLKNGCRTDGRKLMFRSHPPALRDREARREARQLWDEPRAQRGLLACSGLALAAAGAAARRARGVNRRRCVVGRRANAAVEDGLPRRAAIGVAGLAFTVLGLKRFAIDGPPEFDPQPSSLQGKTVVITGGNTGLGRESAVRLARAGARVVLTTRSEAKGVQAVEQVKAASGSSDVYFLKLDLADLSDVKSFKQRFSAQPYGDHIDVLMNNAGVMAIPQRPYVEQVRSGQSWMSMQDGFEEQLGRATRRVERFMAVHGGWSGSGRTATDVHHQPSWLSQSHLQFTEKLFSKGIKTHQILVAQTLHKMTGTVPQVAFVGRSNVGKSTLLNMILHGRPAPVSPFLSESKKLRNPKAAPVSNNPGRTRHLFRFELGAALELVDLPGYGFAKTSKEVRESWRELVDNYLSNADHLERVISLVDARVGVKSSDEQLWDLLLERERQIMVVLTKADQCTPDMLNRTMAHVVSFLETMPSSYVWPYVHAVSGLEGHGVDFLRASVSMVASDYLARKAGNSSRQARWWVWYSSLGTEGLVMLAGCSEVRVRRPFWCRKVVETLR
ncbi:unnamed protein product [Durusdinium trenchii]|uniref:EngB-type G domain-containing protein n=1 Tax=Durusdinium trenchii TaxID=1381693 RepID=A0ABP0S6Z3_9DINO